MVYSFDDKYGVEVTEILAEDQREARGFISYCADNDYRISTKEFKCMKLQDTDKKILELLIRFPLLTKKCIEDIIKENASERIKVLYHAGILSRFSEAVKESGDLIASVYFVSENCFSLLGKAARNTGFPSGSVEDMSIPRRIEVSVLSKWAAYTHYIYGRKEVSLLSYAKPDRSHPYLEAVLIKTVHSCWYKKAIKCKFHVLCRPKSNDAMIPFLETLLYFNRLIQEEEQRMVDGCSRSYVVILCESDDNMERFAMDLDYIFKARKLEDISTTHFLYSLESDAFDEMGVFKFLSAISFPDGTIKRQQVAFR